MTSDNETITLDKIDLQSKLDKLLLEIEKLKDIQQKQESLLYQQGEQTWTIDFIQFKFGYYVLIINNKIIIRD